MTLIAPSRPCLYVVIKLECRKTGDERQKKGGGKVNGKSKTKIKEKLNWLGIILDNRVQLKLIQAIVTETNEHKIRSKK